MTELRYSNPSGVCEQGSKCGQPDCPVCGSPEKARRAGLPWYHSRRRPPKAWPSQRHAAQSLRDRIDSTDNEIEKAYLGEIL